MEDKRKEIFAEVKKILESFSKGMEITKDSDIGMSCMGKRNLYLEGKKCRKYILQLCS